MHELGIVFHIIRSVESVAGAERPAQRVERHARAGRGLGHHPELPDRLLELGVLEKRPHARGKSWP